MIPPLLQQFMERSSLTPDKLDVLVQRDDRVVVRLHDQGGDLVVKLDVATAAFEKKWRPCERWPR